MLSQIRTYSLLTLSIILFALFCLPLAIGTANAQNNKTGISGQVTDTETGGPMSYATVSVYDGAGTLVNGNVTDDAGKFQVQIEPGTYKVEISFISYQPQVFEAITVKEGQMTSLGSTALSPDVETLQEVEVTGERMQMQLSLDKRVFNVAADLANTSGTASDILDNIPSVNVDVEGNVSLRGSENVRILIDGKPSGLTGLGSNDALRLLQGNLIERVEVITNPSARYDAEGEVGIINIVLKKERNGGLNGSFDLGVGHPDNYNAAYNLNYRKGWINLFSSYGISYRRTPGGGTNNITFFEPDTTYSYNQTREHTRASLSHTFRSGADFYLNEKNILTASGLYRWSDGDNDVNILYEDLDAQGEIIQQIRRTEDEEEPGYDVELALSYKKEFEQKDRSFTMDFKYIRQDETEKAQQRETNLTFPAEPVILQRSSNREDEENILFQTDYVQPFGEKGRWEAGAKANIRTINNDYIVEELNENGVYEPLPGFNDTFQYLENIIAAYAMVGNEWEKFSWQAGLRAEYTDISTEVIGSSLNKRDYFNLFPSTHLSYALNKTANVQISYSRRLSRPWFRMLLPFSNYSDSRNFRAGNPDLDPEYTNSFEFSYLKNWAKGNMMASVYYRHRTGVFERIQITSGEGLTTRIPVNLSEQDATGVEFNLSQDLTSWWNVNANFNFYHAVTNGSYEGQVLNAETFTWNSRITSRIKLFEHYDFQQALRYRAPEQNTQGRRLSMTVLDIGLSRDVLKGRGTITFNVRDLFNQRLWRNILETEELYSESEFQWRARQFLLGFNYRLNRNKERKRDRDGGDDMEF